MIISETHHYNNVVVYVFLVEMIVEILEQGPQF